MYDLLVAPGQRVVIEGRGDDVVAVAGVDHHPTACDKKERDW